MSVDFVELLALKGILEGYSDGSLWVNRNITRYEAAMSSTKNLGFWLMTLITGGI